MFLEANFGGIMTNAAKASLRELHHAQGCSGRPPLFGFAGRSIVKTGIRQFFKLSQFERSSLKRSTGTESRQAVRAWQTPRTGNRIFPKPGARPD